VFINEYHTATQLTIFHVDLYRIESDAEIDSVGLADATAGSGICLMRIGKSATLVCTPCPTSTSN
jgi:tRNA A37 threonylcarbamoyladenosine biosynthesis protein TsaE